MNACLRTYLIIILLSMLSACGPEASQSEPVQDAPASEDYERGPNGGRMLRDDGFALELAIFETGVPPEFRAWAYRDDAPIDPERVDLEVTLTRLGAVDEIGFDPQGDFLRGDTVIYEPHSFAVAVEARHDGERYQWQYDSFEGRTRIDPEVADAIGLDTMPAGPATLEETVLLYGRIEPNAERSRDISARFEGTILSVAVAPGDTVRQGEVLATVESNESLRPYTITAPIAGVVAEQTAYSGEQTGARRLFRILDTSTVWAELAVYPGERSRVGVGAKTVVTPAVGDASFEGTISRIAVGAKANQAASAWVVLDNDEGSLLPGTFVTGQVTVAEYAVPLAVKRSALQSFRDFTVVYAQIGDQYEVRMLDLGRQAGEWAEVLSGIEPGTPYVTENSYVLKADVEKSGASHDH